jgi:transcriptional regulator with XRE-family HTH domain
MSRNPPTEALLNEAKHQLGMRIAELRGATKMSQEQAALAAGMSRETWGRIEAGKNHPRFDSLLRMQFVLRVDSLDALFAPTTGDLFGRDP